MNNVEAWEQQKQHLRREFRRILGDFPERTSVRFEVLDKKIEFSEVQRKFINYAGRQVFEDNYICPDEQPDNPTYRRLHIRYPSAVEGQPVYAFLRIPKGLKAKVPAALVLHGHVPGSFFGKQFVDVAAIELTKRGFVTLAPDMFPFGERRDLTWEEFDWENGRGSSHFWGERNWFMSLLLRGQTLLGLHVWELQRAIDILQSLDEVDATRIGSLGHSGGGVNTLWLAALDERVAAAVSSAGVQSYAELAERRIPTAVWSFAPILTVGDAHDLVGLVAPRPFLGVESIHDRFGFDGGYNREHVYPKARALYELYGAGEKLAQHVYEGDHDYHAAQRKVMIAWLERWLMPHSSNRSIR